MKAGEATRRSGVGIAPDTTIRTAAEIMERTGVGALVVVLLDVPVGIVTDRDLVRRALAKDLPAGTRVGAVMSTPLVSVDAEEDLHTVYATFRRHALRRVAVQREGKFIGMLSMDDLLIDLASHLDDLVRPVTAEVVFSHHDVGDRPDGARRRRMATT